MIRFQRIRIAFLGLFSFSRISEPELDIHSKDKVIITSADKLAFPDRIGSDVHSKDRIKNFKTESGNSVRMDFGAGIQRV